MKILADLHHHDLYHSLQILFEKRMGWEIYRPIGIEWYKEDFWAVHPHVDTAKQYLCNVPTKDGLVIIPWPAHLDRIDHRGITLPVFKDTRFDIILSSMPQHFERFQKLRDKYQPHAKHIFQAGNNWGKIPAENLLTSAKGCFSSQNGANIIYYHQEFSLDAYLPVQCKDVRSIMNLQHYSSSIGDLEQLEKELPGWEVFYHGAGCRDKPLSSREKRKKIREIGFIWHVKKEDEGYGYNIHQSFACGTPMVVGYKYQQNFTAGDLYQPGVTIIDFLTLGIKGTARMLENAANDYQTWSDAVYNSFTRVVNFDQEEIRIREFLSNLR